jgi:hypothetical protein
MCEISARSKQAKRKRFKTPGNKILLPGVSALSHPRTNELAVDFSGAAPYVSSCTVDLTVYMYYV